MIIRRCESGKLRKCFDPIIIIIMVGLFSNNAPSSAQDRYDPELNRKPYIPNVTKNADASSKDTINSEHRPQQKIKSNLIDYKQKKIHFFLTYGRSLMRDYEQTIKYIRASGYPYVLAEISDPDEKKVKPQIFQIGVQYNINDRFIVEFSNTRILAQKISGSNWVAGINESVPGIGDLRFDIVQASKTSIIQPGVRYILMPLNIESRLEITTGLGLSYASYHLTSTNYYKQNYGTYRVPVIINAKKESSKFDRNAFGMYCDLGMEFYWSKLISTQFKIERRYAQTINIPEQQFSYVVRKKDNLSGSYIEETQTRFFKKQKIDHSGFILSSTLRIHLF